MKILDKIIEFAKVVYSLPYRRLEEEENYIKSKLALERLGKYQELLELYDKEINEAPYNSCSYLDKAQILTKLKQHEESLEFYSKAIELASNLELGQAYSGKLMTLKILGRKQEAIELCDQMISNQSDNSRFYRDKIELLSELGQVQEAIALCDQCIKNGYGYSDKNIYAMKGKLTVMLGGSLESVLKFYNKAIDMELGIGFKVKPLSTDMYIERANLLFNTGRYQDAIEDYNNLKELHPKDLDIIFKTGIALLNLGKSAQAIEEFNVLIEKTSFNLAWVSTMRC